MPWPGYRPGLRCSLAPSGPPSTKPVRSTGPALQVPPLTVASGTVIWLPALSVSTMLTVCPSSTPVTGALQLHLADARRRCKRFPRSAPRVVSASSRNSHGHLGPGVSLSTVSDARGRVTGARSSLLRVTVRVPSSRLDRSRLVSVQEPSLATVVLNVRVDVPSLRVTSRGRRPAPISAVGAGQG